MAKLKYSKSTLQKQREKLKLYQKLLPSLDLKRRQLTIEYDKAKQDQATAFATLEKYANHVSKELLMLANHEIELSGLVRLKDVHIIEENVVGVQLPKLHRFECEVMDYSFLVRPAWVDVVAKRLEKAAENQIEYNVASERVKILAKAVRRITQRVNLFERLLIPEARDNIKRIQIFLGELERDAIIRSKLAKVKNISVIEMNIG